LSICLGLGGQWWPTTPKQAEMKSELLADQHGDFDYVTMFTRPIWQGQRAREKPLEVATLEKKRQE